MLIYIVTDSRSGGKTQAFYKLEDALSYIEHYDEFQLSSVSIR